MIAEFQRHWEEQYKIKTSEQLQSVIDKRNTRNEKNAQTQRDRNTTVDMDDARGDGDDDDEGGNSEDEHGVYEDGTGSAGDGTVSHSKRRQTRSFYFTTDRVLYTYTYMTSYLPQVYRLSILIDKQSLFINSWLIRLSVDNVLLINTRRLSILIDKTIPLSIGVSTVK